MELWTDTEAGPRPLATRCSQCARISFPVSKACRFCADGEAETVMLSAAATIEALSVMGPLALVHVRTDEGVKLLGQVQAWEGVAPGTRVRFAPIEDRMGFRRDI